MTEPTPDQTPVYIWDYGMTDKQSAWAKQASLAELSALMCSAPLRIACQGAITKEGEDVVLYLPTIHGIPVAQPSCDAQEALRRGQEQVARHRERHAAGPVELDPWALGIAGEEVEEFATPEGREEAFFIEAVRGFKAIADGCDPDAETGLDA